MKTLQIYKRLVALLVLALTLLFFGRGAVYGQMLSDSIQYKNTLTVVPSTLFLSGIRFEYQRAIFSAHHKLGVASTIYYVNFPREKFIQGYKSVALAGVWEYIKSPNRVFTPTLGCTVEISLMQIADAKLGFVEQIKDENPVLVERLIYNEIPLTRGRVLFFVGGQITTDHVVFKPRFSVGIQNKIGETPMHIDDFYDSTQVYQQGVVVEISLNIGGIF